MSIVLGIDTGGTYTDAVVLERDSGKILVTAKERTTHHNLVNGIRNCLNSLNYDDLSQISYVSLSTTLATNAIIENKGCRAGLILLGYDDSFDIPTSMVIRIPGKIDNFGNEVEEISTQAVLSAIDQLKSNVDAIAISGLFSIRNPQHEEDVKDMIAQHLNIPIITAHTLSENLGVQERTITAVLNARLIFLVREFIESVKIVLKERGIEVPIMMLKGDGSLMSASLGCTQPVETILSGPAASIVGARFLTNEKKCFVLDMGGTTIDTAILTDGFPRLRDDGAKIGNWRTKVTTADINTFGLGGDSRILYHHQEKIVSISNQRCFSISYICDMYPSYVRELKSIRFKRNSALPYELAEGLILITPPKADVVLNEVEQQIVEILKDGPHTVFKIAEDLGYVQNFLPFDRLISQGYLCFVGFTPTDVLVYTNDYETGNKEGVSLAAQFIAAKWGISPEELVLAMKEQIEEDLCCIIASSALDYENESNLDHANEIAKYIYKKSFHNKEDKIFEYRFHLDVPVIALGAPAQSWLSDIGERLDTLIHFPQYSSVANAVGAACAEVRKIYQVSIRIHDMMEAYIFTPWARKKIKCSSLIFEQKDESAGFMEYIDQGVAIAIAITKNQIDAEMESQKIVDYGIVIDRIDSQVNNDYTENMRMHIETKLYFIVTGKL